MTTALAPQPTRQTVPAAATPSPSSAMSVLPEAELQQMLALDTMLGEFREQLANTQLGDMARMLLQARAIRALEEAITPAMMKDVMKLMNSPLGFKTDRTKPNEGFYSEDVVRRCLIVAWLSGAKATGNEFNIIAGNCYLTKVFTRPAILRHPGVTHLELDIGAPTQYGEKTAAIPATAKWLVNGEEFTIECIKSERMDARIVVNCYTTSSPDELRGKAEAKLLQRIWSRLTGMNLEPADDTDLGNTVDASVRVTQTSANLPPPVADAATSQPAGEQSGDSGSLDRSDEAAERATDAQTARNICDSFEGDVGALLEVNRVQSALGHAVGLIKSQAGWPDLLKNQTLDRLNEIARDRIEWIRNSRGGRK